MRVGLVVQAFEIEAVGGHRTELEYRRIKTASIIRDSGSALWKKGINALVEAIFLARMTDQRGQIERISRGTPVCFQKGRRNRAVSRPWWKGAIVGFDIDDGLDVECRDVLISVIIAGAMGLGSHLDCLLLGATVAARLNGSRRFRISAPNGAFFPSTLLIPSFCPWHFFRPPGVIPRSALRFSRPGCRLVGTWGNPTDCRFGIFLSSAGFNQLDFKWDFEIGRPRHAVLRRSARDQCRQMCLRSKSATPHGPWRPSRSIQGGLEVTWSSDLMLELVIT